MLKFITYRLFVRGFILTLPLFFISIATPIGAITFDRLFLILAILSMLLLALNKNIKKKQIVISLLIFILYVTLNRLYNQTELNPKYFIMLASILSFYVPFKAIISGFTIEKEIDLSFIIFCVISFYALWFYFKNGFIPYQFPALKAVPFLRPVSYEHMRIVNQSYIFPRLSLPYPTPPQLSIVMAVYSFYFLTKYVLKKQMKYFVFMIIGVFIMLATISRSGIIPFFIVSFLYYNFSNKKKYIYKYLSLIVLILLSLFLLNNYYPRLLQVINYRFFQESKKEFIGGHLEARLYAINMFLKANFKEIFFGIGIGNYPKIHAHMTSLTLLIEIGVVGLILYLFIYFQRIKNCWKMIKVFGIKATDHLVELMILILVFMGMLFYEFTYIFPLYMFMGVACGKSFLEKERLYR